MQKSGINEPATLRAYSSKRCTNHPEFAEPFHSKSRIMFLPFVLCVGALPALGAAQFLVNPPTTADPNTIADCTYWQVAASNDTCASISAYWGITVAQFETYNPSVGGDCELVVGNSYCIEQNYGIPPTSPTPTSSTVVSTTQSPTPTPTTVLGSCEAEAGGYSDHCPQCIYRCEDSSEVATCFESVFSTINYYDSQCWEHGGTDCENKAVEIVCPGAE
ncbi:hypothetical protein BJ170DRAFT_644754 [Xylariales sp. AK1849]|nr:hypothetical protein BJ170DRAFT_644754 [Xylariales sp. AK1849]